MTYPRRRPGAGLLRSLLLGLAVFTTTVLAGVFLSGATTSGPEPVSHASTAAESAASPDQATGTDLAFARSLVYSGTGALVLSVVGLVMVIRRRQQW